MSARRQVLHLTVPDAELAGSVGYDDPVPTLCDGPDPEFQANTTLTGTAQYVSVEEFTVPQPRRWLVRLNLQF